MYDQYINEQHSNSHIKKVLQYYYIPEIAAFSIFYNPSRT